MGAAEPSVRCSGCGAEASEEARFCPGCGQSLGSRLDVQERRRITALFADLVASTSLGEQLDPEIVRGYVARFFARATDEVQRRGGAVEKFSGDAVLALFGLQQAHEDDPERAVRAYRCLWQAGQGAEAPPAAAVAPVLSLEIESLLASAHGALPHDAAPALLPAYGIAFCREAPAVTPRL